jgi:hypothetical protein
MVNGGEPEDAIGECVENGARDCSVRVRENDDAVSVEGVQVDDGGDPWCAAVVPNALKET